MEPKRRETSAQPEQVGNYRILRRIGVGGMGEVFLAEHPMLRKRAAVKIIAKHLSQDDTLVARFQQEALAAAKVRHPGIVEVFDLGILPDGRLYILMEHLEGRTLADELALKGSLPPAEALEILIQVCDALQAAHEAGIVHRDLKPENIFILRDGKGGVRVKVVDFGIAKLLDDPVVQGGFTSTGMILGTPAFMAPEQAAGRADQVSPATDVYALGAVAYQMFAGRPPFSAPTPVELLAHHIRTPAPALNTGRAGLDAMLNPVLQKALAKDPRDRYWSMAEFRRALETVRKGLDASYAETLVPGALDGSVVAGQSSATRAEPHRRHLAWAAGLAVLSIAAGFVLALWLFGRQTHDRKGSPPAHRPREIRGQTSTISRRTLATVPPRSAPSPNALPQVSLSRHANLVSRLDGGGTPRTDTDRTGTPQPRPRERTNPSKPRTRTRPRTRRSATPASPPRLSPRASLDAALGGHPKNPARSTPRGGAQPRAADSTLERRKRDRLRAKSRFEQLKRLRELQYRVSKLVQNRKFREAARAYYELSLEWPNYIRPALYMACLAKDPKLVRRVWKRARMFFTPSEMRTPIRRCAQMGFALGGPPR